jgi:hypothetical protein
VGIISASSCCIIAWFEILSTKCCTAPACLAVCCMLFFFFGGVDFASTRALGGLVSFSVVFLMDGRSSVRKQATWNCVTSRPEVFLEKSSTAAAKHDICGRKIGWWGRWVAVGIRWRFSSTYPAGRRRFVYGNPDLFLWFLSLSMCYFFFPAVLLLYTSTRFMLSIMTSHVWSNKVFVLSWYS